MELPADIDPYIRRTFASRRQSAPQIMTGSIEKVLTFGVWPYGKKQVIVPSGNPSAVAVPAGAIGEAMAGTPLSASGLVQSEYRIAP